MVCHICHRCIGYYDTFRTKNRVKEKKKMLQNSAQFCFVIIIIMHVNPSAIPVHPKHDQSSQVWQSQLFPLTNLFLSARLINRLSRHNHRIAPSLGNTQIRNLSMTSSGDFSSTRY